ncbi:MAG: hypothetical protein AABX82_05955 [Nanoarchaeota archaeon]
MNVEVITDHRTINPDPSQGIYHVNYTIGHANVPKEHREVTNYSWLCLKADSDTEAVEGANDHLLGLEFRLGSQTIYRQEIKLPDGWHYFSRMEGVDSEARKTPALVRPAPQIQKRR